MTTSEMVQAVATQETALSRSLELLKSKNLSKEEHQKLWEEAYDRAVCLLDYKIKMGKLIAETESVKGKRKDLAPVGSKVSKTDIYEALDLTRKQSDDYQLISKYPEAVEKAKAAAQEDKNVPTVYLVKKFINSAKKSQGAASSTETQNKSVVANNDAPTPQYFDIFKDNMKCVDIPSGCGIDDFVNAAIEKLNEENAYSGKTYIFFEASRDKLLEYFKQLKEIFNEVEGGICLRP